MTPDVLGISAAFNSIGGYGPHSDVGDLLAISLDDYGSAVESVEFTAHLRSSRPTDSGMSVLRRQFDERLKRLPSVTFRRSAQRVVIEFVSDHCVAESPEVRAPGPSARAAAGLELEAAMGLLRKRIKSSDDFDIDRFLTDVGAAVRQVKAIRDWDEVRASAQTKR